MTSPENVRLEQKGRVGMVTLDRPDHHNAIEPGMPLGLRASKSAVNLHLDVSITVGTGDHLVGNAFPLFFHFGVFAPHEALD